MRYRSPFMQKRRFIRRCKYVVWFEILYLEIKMLQILFEKQRKM